MHGPLYYYLKEDHHRLDRLLTGSLHDDGTIGENDFAAFRVGILRHIYIEERVLLPELTRLRGGIPLEIASKLRLDHGAVTALLVPPPSRAIIKTLQTIFQSHNPMEEGPGGFYETADLMTDDHVTSLIAKIKAVPDIPLHPHNPNPAVLESTRRAVSRAGYSMDVE